MANSCLQLLIIAPSIIRSSQVFHRKQNARVNAIRIEEHLLINARDLIDPFEILDRQQS